MLFKEQIRCNKNLIKFFTVFYYTKYLVLEDVVLDGINLILILLHYRTILKLL